MTVRTAPLLGAHLSTAGGWAKLFKNAESIGCSCIQIFIKSPRQWHAKPLEESSVQEYLEEYRQSGIKVVVAHSSYLINLATSNPDLKARSIEGLMMELTRCHQLTIPYLVLHPGTTGGAPLEEAIGRISEALNEVFSSLGEPHEFF